MVSLKASGHGLYLINITKLTNWIKLPYKETKISNNNNNNNNINNNAFI